MEQLTSIMLGYLVKQHGITEDAAAELLFESSEGEVDRTKPNKDALQALLQLDQDRVTKLKDGVDTSEVFKQGYDKARSEVLGKAEKKLAKKYGIEDDSLKLDMLVETIVAAATPDDNQLEDDKVKTHPLYLELERNAASEIETLKTTYEDKIKGMETTYAKTETMRGVSSEVLSLFDGLKPVLSSDTVRAGNQRADFAKRFESYDFEKQEDGSYLILQGGKRLEDGHGHPLTLDALVRQEASRTYDFQVQDKKEGTGNGGQTGGSGASAVNVPSSEDEYNEAIFNAKTAEERVAITQAYEASTGS